MNPPVGFGSQVPQNHQGQVPMLAASSNPQTQLNTFFGNVPNTLNPPPFMPGPSFPNGSNMAAFNALMMQNGIMGIQNMQCQPPNFNVVAGFPYQGQFYNAATQNLNQIAGQQLHGQFNLQGMWPQTFAPNVNQIMSLLQGQMNSQNTIAPMNSMLPQQCSTNPFGHAQATPSNNHIFSQYMAAPSCPNNIMFPPNTAQLQAIPRNSQSQFAHPTQPHQNPKEILTERNDETSNAKLGNGRQSFVPSPQVNWKKGNSQTRFLKSNSHHVTNERGGMRSFERNRGGLRKGTQRNCNAEIFDHLPRGPRRCLHLSYTAEEVRQWREARKRNYPTASKIAKVRENCANDEVAKARRKQLRDILAKQAELGVEVAELPDNYLSDPENPNCNRDHKSNFHQRGKHNNVRGRFQNKFSKRGSAGHDSRCIKRYKPMNGEFSAPVAKHSPTLLQKLLSADIKKDKSKLLQVFRFVTLNSFFEHWPEKTLIFPQVTAKDAPFGGDTDRGAATGTSSCFDPFKAEEGIESISGMKDLTEENVDDMNSDEDYGSDESDDNAEEDDHELSDKSEEGEI